ncbi:MAG: hypothetical protein SGPRY_009013 [Prymnesium sp.]
MATAAASVAASQGQKRPRSWDVDISLEELVSWDVLEQFMQEIPGGPGEPMPPGGQTDFALGQTVDHMGGLAPITSSTDPLMLRSTSGLDAIGMPFSASPATWVSGGEASRTLSTVEHVGVTATASGGFHARSGASESGTASDSITCAARSGVMNAASLAQSLYPGWEAAPTSTPNIQPGQNMLGSVSWGSEILPSMIGAGEGDQAIFGSSSPDGGVDSGVAADPPASDSRPVHKTRFVWTAELHRRFEAAVNTLGIDHAKPQAISQLMNCEGEGAPTRQNIKSHLQKYRLLMQKRARQGPDSSSHGGGAGDSGGGKRADAEGERATHPQEPADAQSQLEQHLARQEMNLKVQMELQTKLHRQLLVQRQLQHQLDHSLNSPSDLDSIDQQRWQTTISLKNNLRERLTKHVMMQQEMLHHLDALVSSEVTQPVAAGEEQSAAAPAAPSSGEPARKDAAGLQ